jgi:hypothetical protein
VWTCITLVDFACIYVRITIFLFLFFVLAGGVSFFILWEKKTIEGKSEGINLHGNELKIWNSCTSCRRVRQKAAYLIVLPSACPPICILHDGLNTHTFDHFSFIFPSVIFPSNFKKLSLNLSSEARETKIWNEGRRN